MEYIFDGSEISIIYIPLHISKALDPKYLVFATMFSYRTFYMLLFGMVIYLSS
jgi:hypothetical protein